MPAVKGKLKKCSKGHSFYNSSDCPTCPICEAARKPETGFLSNLVAPARRALERQDITTLARLSKYTESEILELHGMGPSSLPKLRQALHSQGLSFKQRGNSN